MENNTIEILKKAHEKIKSLKEELNQSKSFSFEPIAVVGMACRFPKGVTNPNQFLKALENQRDLIGSPPEKRYQQNNIDDQQKEVFLKEAGYLQEDIEAFDHRLFRFSPREAERTDPQQRLFLKVCWEALENSGYAPDSLRGSKTGVYAGVMLVEYAHKIRQKRISTKKLEPYDVSGNGLSFIAGRTNYFFGFQGPGITIDTACSSSLVSIDNACKGLWTGDCEMALAGGVNLLILQETTTLFSYLNILSPDCRSKSFDASANGTVRGEGCGVVVLKKLSDAEKDGDHIHCVIKATGVNQSGLSSGPTVPHGPSQKKLLQQVWHRAGLVEGAPDYMEAHGTGTEIGDPIEVNSLIELLPKNKEKSFYLGTVKSNLGHLEAAAGVAGFIKSALSLEHKKIFGNLHFNTPSPHIHWQDSSIVVPQKTLHWEKKSQKPRTASVSSFGMSGTNAHVVLEEYSNDKVKNQLSNIPNFSKYPIRFSARNESCLLDQFISFSTFLNKNKNLNMQELSYSQNISRASFKQRNVIWASNSQELESILKKVITNESNSISIDGFWKEESDYLKYDNKDVLFNDISYQDSFEKQLHFFASWMKGESINWRKYYRDCRISKITIPNYQFREKIFTVDDSIELKD